ncbi:MAG: serine/threonine protein kinase [Alphaproteobacteria bacterium]|nr:serine/threonine protein kinase [Alphaproteobacteria bacterium]
MPHDKTESILPLPSAEDPHGSDESPATAPSTFAWEGEAQPEPPAPLTGTIPSDPYQRPRGRPLDDLGDPLETGEAPLVPGYRLLERLGRGGMGEVHLADRVSDTGVTMRCALKVVHPGHQADPLFTRQILSEAQIVAQLRHPNIVQILDVGRTGDRVWMAMEWIDGCDARSLRQLTRERGGEIPLRHLIYLVRETLQGLHHAHRARDTEGNHLGIVHRDISPGNILISRHGAVKLADFGVAAASGVQSLRMAGKPQYLAPEIYRGARASVQSDIFAMGVTFYELLTMQPLFGRNLSFREFEARILAFDPRQLVDGDLTIPDGLEDVLLRSLAAEPEDRYASALDFLEDVSDYAYESGLRLLDAHFARYVDKILAGAEAR